MDFCHCHCSVCRKIHGAAFVSWGGVKAADTHIMADEGQLGRYAFSSDADSVHCRRCGATLFTDYKSEPDRLYIALGSVDGDLSLPPGFHQFVASRAAWFHITDELPQFEAWPEEN